MLKRWIAIDAAEWVALGLSLTEPPDYRTAEERREFGRGFVHGALGLTYDAGYGLEHTLTVCVPLGPYRRGYLAGLSARACRN